MKKHNLVYLLALVLLMLTLLHSAEVQKKDEARIKVPNSHESKHL